MQSLSKSDEQQLLDGVKKAVDLVDNQDFPPNDAIQKIAEELNYSPGFVKAACNAFNNGRQLAQWDANDDVLDKLASFPLANYDEVHNAIWGKEQEKAASVSQFMPKFASYEDQARQDLLNMDLGTFEKSASAEEPSQLVQDYQGELRVKLAFNKADFEGRQVEEARRQKVAAEDKLNLKVHLLESYFKKFAYDRLPLAQVENAAAAYYGKPGAALMSYVAGKFPSEKRASDHQSTWSGFNQPADRNAEPYTLIADCIKHAAIHNQMNYWLAEAEETLAEAKEKTASFIRPQSSSKSGSQLTLTPSLIEETGEKQASLLQGMMGGMGMGLTRAVTDNETDAKRQVENQIAELDSPDHLSELRKIRAQTALTQLMSDPESPLSEYDPEEVMQAYNEIVQLSPRLADQPSALAPLLNRKLMGNAEPFEVGETLKLEESLAKTQATPGLTKDISEDDPQAENKKEESPGSIKPLLDSMEGGVVKAFSGSGNKKSPTDVMNNEASILS
tara:strand:- start:1586 stop:3097 length:1512 start_codon:yes stop_codon:yes gene_type:complete